MVTSTKVEDPQVGVLRRVGDTLRLECYVDGLPSPSIVWYKVKKNESFSKCSLGRVWLKWYGENNIKKWEATNRSIFKCLFHVKGAFISKSWNVKIFNSICHAKGSTPQYPIWQTRGLPPKVLALARGTVRFIATKWKAYWILAELEFPLLVTVWWISVQNYFKRVEPISTHCALCGHHRGVASNKKLGGKIGKKSSICLTTPFAGETYSL